MNYLSYFQYLDIFASPVMIRFKNKNQFSSVLGGIFTVLISVCCIAFTITTGERIIKKTKPEVNYNLQYLESAENYTLGSNEFPFFFNIDSVASEYLKNNSYMTLTLNSYQKVAIFDLKTNTTALKSVRGKLEWELCSENYDYHINKFIVHGYNFTETALNNGFLNGVCLKNNKANNEYVLGGLYGTTFFSNIYMELRSCVNNTSNVVCASEDSINNLLTRNNLQIRYIQYTSNTEDYEYPFFTTMQSYYVKLDLSFFIQTDIYFIPIEIHSDIGFIFEHIIKQKKWNFYEYREQRVYAGNSNSDDEYAGLILRMYINIGLNKEKTSRYYMKAQELAALVGGIIKVLMVAAFLVNQFFNRFLLDEEMINTFFINSTETDLDAELKKEDFSVDRKKRHSSMFRKSISFSGSNSKLHSNDHSNQNSRRNTKTNKKDLIVNKKTGIKLKCSNIGINKATTDIDYTNFPKNSYRNNNKKSTINIINSINDFNNRIEPYRDDNSFGLNFDGKSSNRGFNNKSIIKADIVNTRRNLQEALCNNNSFSIPVENNNKMKKRNQSLSKRSNHDYGKNKKKIKNANFNDLNDNNVLDDISNKANIGSLSIYESKSKINGNEIRNYPDSLYNQVFEKISKSTNNYSTTSKKESTGRNNSSEFIKSSNTNNLYNNIRNEITNNHSSTTKAENQQCSNYRSKYDQENPAFYYDEKGEIVYFNPKKPQYVYYNQKKDIIIKSDSPNAIHKKIQSALANSKLNNNNNTRNTSIRDNYYSTNKPISHSSQKNSNHYTSNIKNLDIDTHIYENYTEKESKTSKHSGYINIDFNKKNNIKHIKNKQSITTAYPDKAKSNSIFNKEKINNNNNNNDEEVNENNSIACLNKNRSYSHKSIKKIENEYNINTNKIGSEIKLMNQKIGDSNISDNIYDSCNTNKSVSENNIDSSNNNHQQSKIKDNDKHISQYLQSQSDYSSEQKDEVSDDINFERFFNKKRAKVRSSQVIDKLVTLKKSLKKNATTIPYEQLKQNKFYHLSYLQILGITLCPCIEKYRRIHVKHKYLTTILYTITDLEEIVNEIALFRESRGEEPGLERDYKIKN